MLINISASPYTFGKNNKRHRVFAKQAKDNNIPLIYVNNIGIQNNGKTIYTLMVLAQFMMKMEISLQLALLIKLKIII